MSTPEYSPALFAVLHELSSPTAAIDMPLRSALCEQAIALVDQASQRELWARLQLDLGNSLSKIQDAKRAENLERAIAAYRQALTVFTREAMPDRWIMTQMNLATAFKNRIRGEAGQNIDDAIACYRQVLEVATRSTMPMPWAQTTMNLANAYMQQVRGDRAELVEQAITCYRQVLEVVTPDADPRLRAEATMNLANGYLSRIRGNRPENIEQAIDHFHTALKTCVVKSQPMLRAQITMNLANAYANRFTGRKAENIEQAIKAYRDVLTVYRQDTVPVLWAEAMMNLAVACRQRIEGDPAENIEHAIYCCNQALTVFTRAGAPASWSSTVSNLATAYSERRRGDPAENLERAIENLSQVLETRSREATPWAWASTMMMLANAYLRRVRGNAGDNIERAIEIYRDLLGGRTRETMPVEWATAMTGLAGAYLRRGKGEPDENFSEAKRCYLEALEVFTLQDMPADHQRTQESLGIALAARDRWAEAVTAYRGALAAHQRVYHLARTPDARLEAMRQATTLPGRLAYALARLGRGDDAAVALEGGRARELAERLAYEQALGRLSDAERSALDDVRTRIGILESELRLPIDTPSKRDFATLSQLLRDLHERLDSLIEGIRSRLPELFSALDFEDIRRAAGNVPLVYLLATDRGGLALVVSSRLRGGIEPVWLPLLAYRDDSVQQRIDGYVLAFGRWRESPADDGRREVFFDTIDALTRWLWDAVMKPLFDAIAPAAEAVLVSGGLLGLLPIHAAWTADPAAPTGRRYALDVASLRFTPCASALMAAARIAERTTADDVLAVAEPRPVHAGPLPSSEHEVETVISCFASHTVLRHEQATKAAVSAEFTRHPVLHFCCHGAADFVEPLDSGLLMANDVFLSLRDLLSLRSPGIRLAVLSACETGIPGLELPDEAIGLPAGLLQAGAAGVVASLWSVADDSTMILMAHFYRLWKAETMDVAQPFRGKTKNRDIAEAFREAQQWVRDSTNSEKAEFQRSLRLHPDANPIGETETNVIEVMALSDPGGRGFAHPFYWAAFNYTGV